MLEQQLETAKRKRRKDGIVNPGKQILKQSTDSKKMAKGKGRKGK